MFGTDAPDIAGARENAAGQAADLEGGHHIPEREAFRRGLAFAGCVETGFGAVRVFEDVSIFEAVSAFDVVPVIDEIHVVALFLFISLCSRHFWWRRRAGSVGVMAETWHWNNAQAGRTKSRNVRS